MAPAKKKKVVEDMKMGPRSAKNPKADKKHQAEQEKLAQNVAVVTMQRVWRGSRVRQAIGYVIALEE
eukprot:CAMPEP_0195070616 /NCGR_PEP_ID=MMETSP0448-20130528/14633_1 /TAXON_ID=66468 /ORGANISM="Heterocapsa triquestra, Strain CCMP 448" /LENGTH=66 /DNA_ID=CAMNT_0040102347 /DNA_START=62 /DNA_END=259 /DNA_ORIENTATION=-